MGEIDKKDVYIGLLEQAKRYSEEYICNIDNMPVFPKPESLESLALFSETMPKTSSDPFEVIASLHNIGSKATTASTGGRYFGFVNGGLLPIAHAAEWLVDTWNQNSALYFMSPISSKLEEICELWLVELFGLKKGTAAGIVTGTSNSLICAFSAARHHLLQKQGYDLTEKGMRNAPPIRVIIGAGAHSSVKAALSVLGFGTKEIEVVPVDDYGRINVDKLPTLDSHTLLIIQAGNVSGGAYDPIDTLCETARKADAWVHIDGAFGLWAAASRKQRHLVAGLENADSYSVDAHKTLNAAYDCGIVLCRHRDSLIRALQASGSYIQYSQHRDGMLYTTEMSRRSRSVILWAVLKQLGADGVEQLVDSLCDNTAYFARELEKAGFHLVNPACFNQFIIKCETPEKTRQVLEFVQNSGVCWCGSSQWNDELVIRISVCSHSTTHEDIDICVGTFKEAFRRSQTH